MSLNNEVDMTQQDEAEKAMYAEALKNGVDFKAIKERFELKTYFIPPSFQVPLHEHGAQDEIFYCIKGKGVGIVDDSRIPFSPGDVFIAPAGSLHSIESDEPLYILAFLFPVNRIVCHCKNVSYIDIRKAMTGGARTVQDIQRITGAGTGCGNCVGEIEKIISIACGCKMIRMDEVITAVNQGANTVEKIGALTGAGTECGNCKMLLQNIIDSGK